MRDIPGTRTISAEQLERIKVLQGLFDDVQDMTELFPYSIGNWIGRMVPEVTGPGPTPSRAVELAWCTLDACQSAIEELAQTHRRGPQREGLSKRSSTAAVPEKQTATSTPQENVSSTPQEDTDNISQPPESVNLDFTSLAEYDELFVQQDRRGGCIFTDDRSDITLMLAAKRPTLFSYYEEDEPENVQLYGEDGARLLAERPFRRVLNRDDESMTTKEIGLFIGFPMKEEGEKCAIAFWSMHLNQHLLCQLLIYEQLHFKSWNRSIRLILVNIEGEVYGRCLSRWQWQGCIKSQRPRRRRKPSLPLLEPILSMGTRSCMKQWSAWQCSKESAGEIFLALA